MNNGGIYGGDRRERDLVAAASQGAASGGFGQDPIPTAFVPASRYDLLMQVSETMACGSYRTGPGVHTRRAATAWWWAQAFGGNGLRASSRTALLQALRQAAERASRERLPSLVEVVLDPLAGVESGNVHAFNAPKSKI